MLFKILQLPVALLFLKDKALKNNNKLYKIIIKTIILIMKALLIINSKDNNLYIKIHKTKINYCKNKYNFSLKFFFIYIYKNINKLKYNLVLNIFIFIENDFFLNIRLKIN